MKFKYGTTSGGECCQNCKDRHVGCHNIETCEKWAAAEKKREKEKRNRAEAAAKAQMICDIVENGRRRRR